MGVVVAIAVAVPVAVVAALIVLILIVGALLYNCKLIVIYCIDIKCMNCIVLSCAITLLYSLKK